MSNDKNATPKVFEHPAGFKLHPVAWGNETRSKHVIGFVTEGFDALSGKELVLRVGSEVRLNGKPVDLPAIVTEEILGEMIRTFMADLTVFKQAAAFEESDFMEVVFPAATWLGIPGAVAEFAVITMGDLKKHGSSDVVEKAFKTNFRQSPRYKEGEMFDFVVINMNSINQALYDARPVLN